MKHELNLNTGYVPSNTETNEILLNEDDEYVVKVPSDIVELMGGADEDKYVEWCWKIEYNKLKYDVRIVKEKDRPRYKNFHFNKEGTTITGVLDSITPNMHPKHRNQNIYNIQISNGEVFSVFGTYEIDKNISLSNIGDNISIEYLGKKYDKTGKYTKQFSVETY